MGLLHAFDALPALGHRPCVAVAVSGGPDSMALVHAVQKWLDVLQGHLTALIVDHGLRTNSTDEAQGVAQALQDLGISSVILPWQGQKPTTRVQETARAMRHQLLKEWCQNHHVPNLFLGHHQDDQQETQMMRLLRGSHLKGMTGMQAVTYHPFGRLLRPFLKTPKQDLVDYCQGHSIPFVTDPSNQSPRFLRTHLRKMKATQAPLFTFPAHTLAQTLEDWVGRFLWHHGYFKTLVVVSIDKKSYLDLPPFFQHELLLYIIMKWGKSCAYGPRTDAVTRLCDRVKGGQKSTLRNLEFSLKNDYLEIKIRQIS